MELSGEQSDTESMEELGMREDGLSAGRRCFDGAAQYGLLLEQSPTEYRQLSHKRLED